MEYTSPIVIIMALIQLALKLSWEDFGHQLMEAGSMSTFVFNHPRHVLFRFR